ncbi:chromosome segregation protein SMC [Planctomycetota bacterium]|nr:chromosome segregation protein SMC [Planctomycetota bacterium]
MRIQSLEMDGFKSFGNATKFDFPADVTGIVGPNGCGKSNVVDATRWVLGEMSRKALRAKSSIDVIFSGSSTRKPARKASVSITFDNSDGTLPYSSNAVKVTRMLHKNGDSEYRINDEVCKLRDVRGLFQGTGATMSAYSIMEQGKMDALLKSNPEDRRKVFEEAAGIGQMRKKQELAQNKLKLVDQNLERLKDILSQVKGRLRKIKSQASRALKYTELKERARIINQDIALVEFNRLNKDREVLLSTISEAGKREGAIQADLAKTKMDMEDAETKLADAEHEERRLADRIHKLEIDVNNESASRERALGRIDSLKQAITRAKELSERVRNQVASLKDRRETIGATANATRDELAELTKQLSKLSTDEAAMRADANAMENELKEVRSGLLDSIDTTNKGLNERLQLEADLRTARRRLETLGTRTEEVGRELSDVSQRRDTAAANSESFEHELNNLREEMQGLEQQLPAAKANVTDLRQRQHNLELKRHAKSERKDLLETLAESREALDDHATKLLEDADRCKSFGIQGLLADSVSVDLAFAAALENVLGELGGALVVDSLEHAHDLFDFLAGRGSNSLSIIASNQFRVPTKPTQFPGGKGVIGPLMDEIKVDDSLRTLLETLLSDVLLVADRTVARKLVRNGDVNFRIVTPTGEMFSQPGTFALAVGEANTGIISQKSEIERLGNELDALDIELEEGFKNVTNAGTELDALGTRAGELRATIYDKSMETASKRAAVETLSREAKRLAEEAGVLTVEQSNIERQINEDSTRHDELTEAVAEAEQTRKKCEERLHELNDTATEKREALAAAQIAVTTVRVEEAEKKTRLHQSEDSLQGIDQALTRYADEIARGATEVEAHAKETRELEHKANSSVEVQAELEREIKELEERRGASDSILTERRSVVEAARGQVTDLQEKLYSERESVQQARIDENTLFMKMDAVRRRLAEIYNADIDSLYRDYNPNLRTIHIEECKSELVAVEEQLRRLGNVNMEAMDELKDAEEQNTFYSKQEIDLLKAKRTLSEAIARIERETKKMFVTTFEAVRENFQRLFRRLFGGGSAELLLTNPAEPLESGVEIIARPPGKEALPIAMRSGGERAMISVAMMFAIYETNPAPFAILDEVDAPLDEANVDRFNSVIGDYAKASQFIIITHHKKTMVACDALYGVTMQEPGTSTKVGVDLRKAEEAELVGV